MSFIISTSVRRPLFNVTSTGLKANREFTGWAIRFLWLLDDTLHEANVFGWRLDVLRDSIPDARQIMREKNRRRYLSRWIGNQSFNHMLHVVA